jgi:hypothetical protein
VNEQDWLDRGYSEEEVAWILLADEAADNGVTDLDRVVQYVRLASGDTPLVNGARPINGRRTRCDMQAIREGLWRIVRNDRPMTVRQVFYRAVSAGLVGKTEVEYKGTVGRLLVEMRRAGVLPYGWIADNTRWMRKPRTWHGLQDMLEEQTRLYRRALWDSQEYRCEVWLEKDALAGVILDVTDPWDVPLMVTRGYPSLSFLHEAAEAINDDGKPTAIYYLGDHDPSGEDIPRKVEEELIERADVAIDFQKLAVTVDQIGEFQLPTRPTKRTDSRAKNFEGESVEVDAIPPAALRALVEDAITALVDTDRLASLRSVEAAERETFREFTSRFTTERNGDGDR